MRDVIEHDPYPVVLFDPSGVVHLANAAARELALQGPCTQLSHVVTPVAAAAMCSRGQAMLDEGADPRARWKLALDLGERGTFTASLSARGADVEAPLVLRILPEARPDRGETLLRRLVAHTPGTGQTFFEQLVVHLAAKLGVKYAFVAEISGAGGARTVALCKDGRIEPSFEYELTGTPCEEAVLNGICYVPEDLGPAFPDDPHIDELGVDSYLGVPLVTTDGEVLGVLALMDDGPIDDSRDPVGFIRLFAARTATELHRLRAQAQADKQRAFTDHLLDQVDALVLVLDEAGRICRANRTVGRVTGWTEAELIGLRLPDTFASERARGAVQSALEAAIPVMLEDTWTTPSGEERQIRWQVRPLRDEDGGDPGHLLVTGVDMTALEATRRERDALQGRLVQARRLEGLGRLAGGVAHDFNNLLLAILGYTDIIQSNLDAPLEVVEASAEIRRAADHAASLTRQLLAFGRRQRLERRGLDLVQVIESATAVLRPIVPDDIEIVVELPDEPVRVRADPSRLEQVIVNLGANARDAMPGGGRLMLRATVLPASESPLPRRGRPVALIEVSDTGTGIDDTVLPHIFEPFFTTKELGHGTGLGLASVYGTVQQHGGTVDVKTQADNGTTFRIFLPLDASGGVEVRRGVDAVAGPGAGRLILVAEDDERVRTLVARLLEGAGYQVVAHPDGAEAWEEFKAHPGDFDLVFADVLMPKLGGLDLASRVREHSPDKPVMLTSGFVADLSEFPADVRLLPKPYMPDDLLSAVGEVLAAS